MSVLWTYTRVSASIRNTKILRKMKKFMSLQAVFDLWLTYSWDHAVTEVRRLSIVVLIASMSDTQAILTCSLSFICAKASSNSNMLEYNISICHKDIINMKRPRHVVKYIMEHRLFSSISSCAILIFIVFEIFCLQIKILNRFSVLFREKKIFRNNLNLKSVNTFHICVGKVSRNLNIFVVRRCCRSIEIRGYGCHFVVALKFFIVILIIFIAIFPGIRI